MGNYTNINNPIRPRERKEGVECLRIPKGKQKGTWYIVNVPDYDNDCPQRIISIGKYRDAKEAQAYYEAWTSTHRPASEQRKAEKVEEVREARERKAGRFSTDPEKQTLSGRDRENPKPKAADKKEKQKEQNDSPLSSSSSPDSGNEPKGTDFFEMSAKFILFDVNS